MNDRRKSAVCYLMIGLMLLSTTASAANITTFADSSISVVVELRDPSNYEDTISGAISLPEGETITSAQMNISTSFATHDDFTTYDQSIMPPGAGGIWDARYNSGLTTYSDLNCHSQSMTDCSFTATQPNLALTSKGFNADFEVSSQGMVPGPPVDTFNWERVSQGPGPILPAGCYSGEYCWGTNFNDGDYTNDDPIATSFEYNLETPSIYVYAGKGSASFKSFHSTYFRTAGGANSYYYDDCAYVAVANSSDNNFFLPWSYIPFDLSSVTGINPGTNGMFQKFNGVGSSVNKVQTNCNGKGSMTVPSDAWVLAGQSSNLNNANGWATLGLDLTVHEGKYVKLKFVLERNPQSGAPVNASMQGWYIDALRIGDPLPQMGSVVMKSFSPIKPPNPGFPDGYGLLDIEVATSSTTSFTVDILDASNGQIVIDRNGLQLSGLTGEVIELWDINSSIYGLIDLRFNYNSGVSRLSSPDVWGFSIGTRIGTGLNSSSALEALGGEFGDGSWSTNQEGGAIFYAATIDDYSWTPLLERNRFSMPVVAVKPMVHDSCGATNRQLMVGTSGANSISPVNNQWATLTAPSAMIGIGVMYTGACTVYGIWLDIRFGHSFSEVSLDVAGDGDLEWGFLEPAFGGFGRQQTFRTQEVGGVNLGADSMLISMNINGIGQGASFMLPDGCRVDSAAVAFEGSTVGNASITLLAGPSSQNLGYTGEYTRMTPEAGGNLSEFSTEIQNLLDDPNVPVSHIDEFGNEWVLFRFHYENPSSSSGASLTMRNLDILYTWERTLSDDNGFARELNQGVALGTPVGGQVAVPVKVNSATGGALALSALSVTTESGYHTSMNTTGDWTGLYADGGVYGVVSTHSVDAFTGAVITGASLQFESESGLAEIRWTSANDSFWEIDDGDRVSLMAAQSSSAVTAEGASEITWRFRVNPDWEDSASARVFSTLITDSGSEGLPAAVLLNPTGGNAVENDAGIADLTVYNQAGTEQTDLSHMDSNQVITLEGTVRFENLPVAPDPASYSLVFEQQNASNITEWTEIDRTPGLAGGNFSWQPAISPLAAGNDTYRLRIANYTGGDTVCPPSQFNPDSECAIHMTLFIDSYSPYLVNISVHDGFQDWRFLQDDTWIPPRANQKFRVIVRDIPTTPDSLLLNYWIEAQHDENDNRIPEPSEYHSVPMLPDSTDVNGNTTYFISNPSCQPTADCIDDRQQGLEIPEGDPAPRTSLYISGTDQSGNPVGGGSEGFINDLITYIGRDSRAPGIYSFHVDDAYGNPLTEFNKSMYAGNIYHLLVDGKDENGWRDVEYIKIDMNPNIADDMVLYYGPRNGTAWTSSQQVDILDIEVDGIGPRLTRLDGNALIDPFEVEFLLDLPIRLHWGVTTVQGVVYPEVYMRDLDPTHEEESRLSSSRYKQNWAYSSGVKFDRQTLQVSDTSGFITTSVGTLEGGFVRPGDLLLLQGSYRFKEALEAGIDVKPQIPLTLELTRYPIYPGGESDLPGSGYVAASEETFFYVFDNGTFDLIIPAALSTNEYRYVWRLCDSGCDVMLPVGATDSTIQDDRTFYVKVDNEAPKVVWGSWNMLSGTTSEEYVGILPSSTVHCVSIDFAVEERQKLVDNSIELNWMFYKNDLNWSQYRSTFPEPWQTSPMEIDLGSSPYRTSVNCLDLWPGYDLPSDLEGVDLLFWVTGSDSAGNGVSLAGQFGSAVQGGEYQMKYQEAEFRIDNVVISPSQPEATENFELIIQITNTGTDSGNLDLQLFIIIDDRQTGNVNYSCDKTWDPSMTAYCRVPIQAFPEPITGVQIKIHDSKGNLLGETESFHIRAAGTGQDTESNLMLYAGITLGVVVIVAIAVAALMLLGRRREDDDEDDFFIEDEDYLPEAEAVQPMSRTPPRAAVAEDTGGYAAEAASTPPGYGAPSSGPPGAGDSQMDRARRLFPFWDDATIQGYFDQGWSIQQLQDWVKENK